MADDATKSKEPLDDDADINISTNTGGSEELVECDSTESTLGSEYQQVHQVDSNGDGFKVPTFAVPLALSSRPKPLSRVRVKQQKHDVDDKSNSHSTLSSNKECVSGETNISDFEESSSEKDNHKLDQCLQLDPSLYSEPEWGGKADDDEEYSFDILKNGTIIGNIPIKGQSFFVFGRLKSCDVTLEHPSLSRYHAVIQHSISNSKEEAQTYEKGWYIYDLDSTHGTWVNKRKLKPKQYYRLKVGYVIKFGGSSRLHILQGPDNDVEEESELTVTELKQQRDKQKREAELLHQNKLQETQRQQEAELKVLEDQGQGCSWGMGEDAQDNEEENSFGSIVPENESTYIDDPKKALKGYYEREGCDLPDYQFTEMSLGKHKCRLELPVDGPNGEELVAEAVVSGKKKDAVIACALEACRLLDRMGMLRQSQHESRKRKQKNWEADDFYDSDEDTFLDRTGTIEKKRSIRMKKAGKDETETYESLMEKYTKVASRIEEIETQLAKAKAEAEALAKEEMDELDAYMYSIKSGAMDTKTRMRLKGELLHLKMEEKHLLKLVNIAKPASLPPLKSRALETTKAVESFTSRLQHKLLQRQKQSKSAPVLKDASFDVKPDNFEEEEDEEDEGEEDEKKQEVNNGQNSPTVVQRTSSSPENYRTSSIPIMTETMDTSETSHSPSKQKSHTSPSLESKSPVVKLKGPHFPKKTPPISSKPQKKSHTFSTTQAIDALDRASGKKQSQADAQFEEHDPDYAVWLPPTEQSGDGRTSLNDKLGY